jgi:hypothetical protein
VVSLPSGFPTMESINKTLLMLLTVVVDAVNINIFRHRSRRTVDDVFSAESVKCVDNKVPK